MKKQAKKRWKFTNIIKEHVKNNLKQYLIISIVFIIGVILGVILVNNSQLQIKEQIESTIKTSINSLKNDNYQIDYIKLLKSIIIKHTVFAILLWFLGCSVIGIPIVYLLIAYRGFSLGYTISSIILVLGIGQGSIFSIIALFLQNLLIIPTILAIAISGTKLYSSIMKNKKIDNIKLEIIRHTIFCLIMLIVLIIAALVETYISSFLITIWKDLGHVQNFP